MTSFMLLLQQKVLSRCPVRRMIVILLTQPRVVPVEPVICRPHFPPLWSAEDAIGIVAILANPIELYGVQPVFGQVLLWEGGKYKSELYGVHPVFGQVLLWKGGKYKSELRTH